MQLQLTFNDFLGILPEFALLVMAAMILMLGLFTKKDSELPYLATQLSLLLVLALTIYVHHFPIHSIFQGGMVTDQLSFVMATVIYAASFFVFVYSRVYLKERNMPGCEYYVLGLLSIVGMSVLVSAHNLLVLYLALELFSLPIYTMVAMRRENTRCIEASLKYFVMGALASGLLLYGISLYYGATGSLDIGTVAAHVQSLPRGFNLLLIMGLVFMTAGVVFKLGAVPFHMWVPDVYEGAPACVTLFISAAPKLAAMGLMIRLLVDTSQSLSPYWQQILIIVSILSMALGNFVAIVQTNLKRMLAYSSIAHIGYMLLGFVCATKAGYQASLFYMISYVLMSLGGFGFIVMMSHSGFEAEHIEDFSGLNSRNPWLAFMMLVIMFSLAGIPPLVGFIAKVSVLEALIQVHLVWLAVVSLLFAIVGSYYYIRVVKVMYFDEPVDLTAVTPARDAQIAMTINGMATLAVGIFPGFLFHICHMAFF